MPLPQNAWTALVAHVLPGRGAAALEGLLRLAEHPQDPLLVLVLVLLAAQGGRGALDRQPVLLPLAWLVGSLVGISLPRELSLALPSTLAVAALALLVALAVRLPPRLVLLLSAVLPLLCGLAAGSSLAGHAGALPALLAPAALIAALTIVLRQAFAPPHPRWLAIGLRVLGSWICAASLLMAGAMLRASP